MKQYQRKIVVFDYDPRKVLLMGVLELEDVVGALSEASSIVARMGVNLSSSASYSVEGEKIAVWSWVGVAKPGMSVEKLEQALRDSPVVTNFTLRKSDDGLLSDTLHFPVKVGNISNAVIFASATMTSMFLQMKKLFGSGGDVLLYEQGVAAGTQVANGLAKAIPLERLRKLDEDVMGLYSAVGWGKPKVISRDQDGSNLAIEITDSFETMNVKSDLPSCQFVRGVLAGSFGTFFEKKYSCKETECAAAGAPACRFVLASQ